MKNAIHIIHSKNLVAQSRPNPKAKIWEQNRKKKACYCTFKSSRNRRGKQLAEMEPRDENKYFMALSLWQKVSDPTCSSLSSLGSVKQSTDLFVAGEYCLSSFFYSTLEESLLHQRFRQPVGHALIGAFLCSSSFLGLLLLLGWLPHPLPPPPQQL